MSGRSALRGMSNRPAATRDIYSPRDSIPAAESLDADFAAMCFALAALFFPIALGGFGFFIWWVFFH